MIKQINDLMIWYFYEQIPHGNICCMLIGIPIAFINPTEGGLREEPIIGLFYVSIAGLIIIVLYSSMQTRKEQQRLRRERRKKFRK